MTELLELIGILASLKEESLEEDKMVIKLEILIGRRLIQKGDLS
jgi:hypothetical protein